ncbi:FecCD family ABC transporter permease [Spiribacter halobius]|uniref:Iron ABC transporter permease n=1 Tax=Sediminicurvatus halobius TaxID=2182432 RepID=A0A2U2N2D1_9GAMM|nr:iron chelate uptake ABC transporter family permease subunit [Spiribacter halobius]PWG63134.1 iron ABC transporter permease [Spiribacter halobius]UEX77584.1 iron chelate uptake ABC transporter family permease subunit [Spiribacter halobius]
MSGARLALRLPRPLAASWRVGRRTLLLAALALASVPVAALLALGLGEYPLGPWGSLQALLGAHGDSLGQFIVAELRAPRVAAALLVGAALGASGAVFQGLVRNPLVAPDIIGINAGAGLAAVLVIVGGAGVLALPAAALAGAIVTAVVVYALTWRQGITGGRLVLVGIGVNALLAALTTLVLLRAPVEQATPAVVWLTGSLALRDWGHAALAAGGMALLLPALLLLWPRLAALELGDDSARALGVRAERDRLLLLACGAALAGLAVAVAGPLAFVALMVPHLARLLVGPLSGGGVVLAAALGALLVLAADLLGQHAFAPARLPVGLITASVGAPFFLFLLYRVNRSL